CGKEFPKLAKLRIHLNRKYPCRPQNPIPLPEPILEAENNEKPDEIWSELGGNLLADKAKSKKFRSLHRDHGIASIYVKPPKGNLIFEECEINDPERPQSMSKWQAIVPSFENPAYEFNIPIKDGQKYAETPYMPQLMASAKDQITRVLKAELRKKDQIKSAIVVYCNYMRKDKKDTDKLPITNYLQEYHRGRMRVILSEQDIDEHISLTAGEVDKKIEEFLKSGSGWTLIRIEMMFIEAYTLRRAEGGSYRPTPKNLANKKCTVNPDNSKTKDDLCLKYAVGAYFANYEGITKNLQRLSVIQPYLNRVNLDGIPMPTPICNRTFQKIEAQNPNISINVWEWKNETATPKPVIASKNFYIPNSCTIDGCIHSNPNECHKKRPHVIHLMALSDTTKTDGKYGIKNHFLWIKNPDALVFKDSKHEHKKHLCNRCFQSWSSEKSLSQHQKWCFGLGEAPQKVTMPEKGINDIEKFKNYARMIYAPCVIIADFESDNKKCDESYGGNMHKFAEQKANSFCYAVHWIDTGETWGPFIYRGPNATQEFVKRIDNELVQINNVLSIKTERIVTAEYRKKFDNADECWICHKELNGDKVWDHCHITGKFRGAAHNDCNLKLQITPWKTPIPILFHNFRGYDSHLICESVGRSVNAKQINVIAETFERYKSMRVGQLRYIDSMQFMNTSLAKLAENLGAVKCKDSNCKHFHRIDNNRCFGTLENHRITCQIYKKLSPEQIALVCRKGVYPYEYIDSHDRFSETKLPPFHEFHGKLKGKISQEDYDYAQKVWNKFECKNLGEYHDLYLKTDVLVLTDIWTKFRETSMKYYKLDPSHYVSAPALSWDAMLKMTGVEIELFTEMAMHDFTEKAKRGGIAMACHRYFKANNPKMGKDFDPTQPTTWISYVDANNLYGWAMSQFLPIGDYKWVVSKEYLSKHPAMQKKYLNMILKTKADSPRGYFLNIKAHFPKNTHDYLNDLPPAVDNIVVKRDWLSPYNKKLVHELDGDQFSETKKLVPHLGKREDYVIHYQELQYYVKLGMVVDEVTEILSFKQTNWLAPYIDFNTKLRQKSVNDFEKDFFKLMNNSCYGKTMENVRKYQDVKIMSLNGDDDEKKFRKKIRKPSFKYARQFSDTLIGAHMGKASVVLNKPIIVGASVLGLSKLHMYRFWYDYVKDKYGNKAKLGYMDTDSFIFQTETEDIYKDMAERPDIFDLNDTKTIGLFKDECSGKVITESFNIRAKTYHYVISDGSIRSKHKGVSKAGMREMALDTYMPALAKSLFDNPIDEAEVFDPMTQVYRDCLFDNEVFYAKNIGFRTKDHIISLVESEKKALCPIDTKRWILSDRITSLAYDHWRIDTYESMIKAGITPELAEGRAMRVKLKPEIESLIEEHIA
ncbi:9444_t:CDS:1, partial [Paraglomus occultum]